MDNKKATVAQIAAAANVSPATVSRVLNHRDLVKPATIQAIEQAMFELGYEAPAKVRTAVTKGVIILAKPRNDMFYDEIIKGAKVAAESAGYYLLESLFTITSGNVDDFIALIKRTGAAGVIVMNQLPEAVIDKLSTVARIIQCAEFNPEVSYPYVSIDDFAAASKATEHLIAAGRRRIAFVNSSLDFKYATERRRGYYSALAKANISVPRYFEIQLSDNNYSLAYAAVSQLLHYDDKAPDAFFATSDIMAAAVLNSAIAHSFRVPEDIMIIGFDDIELAQITNPALTTIRQPRYLLGYTACNMVIQQITNPEIPIKSLTLDTELIVRKSTAVDFWN